MNIIGKTTINPFIFYTGKFSGYTTWILAIILLFGYNIIHRTTIFENGLISSIIAIIGLLVIILSLINLGRSTRLGLPTENTAFKTTGLYRYSRNPMYVGFHLLTIAAMIHTLNIFIIILGLYSFIVYHYIILGEEQFLNERFGSEYFVYMRKIRRYI